MPNIEEYDALTTLVNNNLAQNGQDMITFETSHNIYENIFHFPVSKLLNIQSDKVFVYEIYYKILNRMIDDHTENYFLGLLKHKTIHRIDLIKDLIKSNECKKKKTKLIFDQEQTL